MRTSGNETDEQVMARYLANDREAFNVLDGRFRKRLERFFQRCGLDADELSQRTLVQVVVARHQFRQSDRVRPWVMAIARNLASDQVRRSAREVDADVLEQLPSMVDVEGQVDQRRQATRALERLDAATRQLLIAHHVEGHAFHELAQSLGTSANTLKVRAHRAYGRLRRASARRARHPGMHRPPAND